MGFNVTSPGQKVTGYEGTVGLDVTKNKATGEKVTLLTSTIFFCQITGQRPCCFVLYNHLCEIHPILLSSIERKHIFHNYMHSHHTVFLLSSC